MTVRVNIHEAEIARLNLPGEPVHRWVSRLGRETFGLTSARCPFRTGQLLRSLGWGVTPHPQGCEATVRATAHHARYVMEGTTGPIHATFAKAMLVQPWPRSNYLTPTRRTSVAGQRANPFMEESFRVILTKHRV